MTRVLPGVYVSLYDQSTLPESENNLTVGYVLKADRGPVGKCELVTSSLDFLNKYTFGGQPTVKDDTTFWSILQVLKSTNQVYVSRASKNAVFGGLVVKKDTDLGMVKATASSAKTITVAGTVTVTAGDKIRIFGADKVDGRYTVASSATSGSDTVITISEDIKDYTAPATPVAKLIKIGGVSAPVFHVATIEATTAETTTGKGKITLDDDYSGAIEPTAIITISGSSTTANNKQYTVASVAYDDTTEKTVIEVNESISTSSTSAGTLNRVSILDPENYAFGADDLFVIAGIDPGAYNNKIGILVTSSSESPEDLTEDNVFTIAVYDATTMELLENPWMCSRNPQAKAVDGSGIFMDEVLKGSAYIQGKCNQEVDVTLLPSNVHTERLSGGTNGVELTTSDYVAALELFADKTIPISILGNGSQENQAFQQAMISIADTRKDCVAFINSRKSDETATFNSKKAANIVTYKKSDLGSTSFYATMYAPHVNYPDIFNSRQIKLGADAIAISGWLNTIVNQGYPYAYAGPTYGLVNGVTTNWKIGDNSGEATQLNNASVNYVAYDAKVGRYYMQCQNTLQIANSSLRNLGAVFNVLDIKETFATYFKEYLQRPITSALRSEIIQKGVDYMNTVLSQGRCTNYTFVDMSTDTDISNNTLRYGLTLSLTPYSQVINVSITCVNQTYDFAITQG